MATATTNPRWAPLTPKVEGGPHEALFFDQSKWGQDKVRDDREGDDADFESDTLDEHGEMSDDDHKASEEEVAF